MENGQKVPISLESPIDVKSSDMLVPVNSPQFAHNRQKYQGHCLPNSLRFEADGWAAGNTVYNITADKGEYVTGNWKVKRSVLNNNPAYLFEYYYKNEQGLYDYVGNICFNTASSIQNQYNINRDDISMTADTLTGEFRGSTFSVQVLPETDTSNSNTLQKFNVTVNGNMDVLIAGETIDIDTLRFQCEVQNNGICILKLSDLSTSTGNIDIRFKKASKVVNGDYVVADYTGTDNNVHFYDKYDRHIVVNNTDVSVSPSKSVSDISLIDNTLTFTFVYTYNSEMQLTILGVSQINYLYNCITERANGSLFDIIIDDYMYDIVTDTDTEHILVNKCINTTDSVGKVRTVIAYKPKAFTEAFVMSYAPGLPFLFYNMSDSNSDGK